MDGFSTRADANESGGAVIASSLAGASRGPCGDGSESHPLGRAVFSSRRLHGPAAGRSAAMAAFMAARQMGWWLRDRMWIAAAPVIVVAWAESILGLVQFYSMRGGGLNVGSVTGTYVNRNHFAGLLELAFPLALMWSISVWRRGVTQPDQPAKTALRAASCWPWQRACWRASLYRYRAWAFCRL